MPHEQVLFLFHRRGCSLIADRSLVAIDLAARFFALVATVFCGALALAAFGYGNMLVMLWMVAGPLLFFASLALLALHTAIRVTTSSMVGAHASVFLALGMSILGFAILKLLGGGTSLPLLGAALVGFGFALAIPRIPLKWAAEISGLGLALASWLLDEWLLPAVAASVCTIALSVTAVPSDRHDAEPS